MEHSPYQDLPARAFWRPAVADRSLFEIETVWEPKFAIKPTDPVVTFGSCFAQHIGRALGARGYNWHVTERAPEMLSAANRQRFNYELFSARTGNIYTTSLLAQWVSWASGDSTPPPEIWQEGDRFFDPFRPRVEPNGFASPEEMLMSRDQAILYFREAIRTARVFVFTMGLTESWKDVRGFEYPVCPGSAAGRFDATQHRFENQVFTQVHAGLVQALHTMVRLNPRLKFILTVSPVPLTATNSGNHVVTATTESKSVLRAVAGQLQHNRPNIDYFPSYELITQPSSRGIFYAPNMRSVTDAGVAFVMEHFFRPLPKAPSNGPSVERIVPAEPSQLVCEEELLDAFAL